MSDLSAMPRLDLEALVLARGALPDAPLKMPQQPLERARRPWLAGLIGSRQQPDRA